MLTRRRALRLAASILVILGPRASASADDGDLLQLVKAGALDQARDLAAQWSAASPAASEPRLLAGILCFATGAYPEARAWLDRDYAADNYIFGSLTAADDDILRTKLGRNEWLYLASQRAHVPIANVLTPPLLFVATGHQTVDEYAARQASADRAAIDGLILSFANSPGRQALLDSLARKSEPEHRCTANLLLAEMALARDDRAAARTLLSAATGHALPELLEYYIAIAELARLG